MHDRLAAFVKNKIKELDKEPDGELRDDTSLLKSSLLDSLALLELAVWIEHEVGTQMDLTKVDILQEWDTMANILNFIHNHRAHES